MPSQNSKAPRCKLCGKNHWASEDHIFDGPPPQAVQQSNEPTGALSTTESSTLARCEAIIERGLETWYEVGGALSEIRDGRLYRETHKTFEAYCQERWSFTKVRANQLVTGSTLVTMVTKSGLPKPRNERVARELTPLKDEPERLVETWQQVNEASEPVTAERVRQAVRGEPPTVQTIEVPRTSLEATLEHIGASLADAWQLAEDNPPQGDYRSKLVNDCLTIAKASRELAAKLSE